MMKHKIYLIQDYQCGYCYYHMICKAGIGRPATVECVNLACPYNGIPYLLKPIEVDRAQNLPAEGTDRGVTEDPRSPGPS